MAEVVTRHKVCSRCKVCKSCDAFAKRSGRSNGLSSWCRACAKESAIERYYRNHIHQRAMRKESTQRLRKEKARNVYEYLKCHPCVDCGISDPLVLEFDHKSGVDKTEAIAQLVNRNWAWKKILDEMQKCEVRCANCHRRKTASQFGYLRIGFAENDTHAGEYVAPPEEHLPIRTNTNHVPGYASVSDFLKARQTNREIKYLGLKVAARAKSVCREDKVKVLFAANLEANLYPVEALERAWSKIQLELSL